MQPQTITFKDSITGKTYKMPWAKPEPPSDTELEDFVFQSEIKASSPAAEVDPIKRGAKFFTELDKPLWTGISKGAKKLSLLIDPDDPQKGRSTGGLRGYGSAFIESLGNVADSMTSPVNLGMAAATAGTGLITKSALSAGKRAIEAKRLAKAATELNHVDDIVDSTKLAADIAEGSARRRNLLAGAAQIATNSGNLALAGKGAIQGFDAYQNDDSAGMVGSGIEALVGGLGYRYGQRGSANLLKQSYQLKDKVDPVVTVDDFVNGADEIDIEVPREVTKAARESKVVTPKVKPEPLAPIEELIAEAEASIRKPIPAPKAKPLPTTARGISRKMDEALAEVDSIELNPVEDINTIGAGMDDAIAGRVPKKPNVTRTVLRNTEEAFEKVLGNKTSPVNPNQITLFRPTRGSIQKYMDDGYSIDPIQTKTKDTVVLVKDVQDVPDIGVRVGDATKGPSLPVSPKLPRDLSSKAPIGYRDVGMRFDDDVDLAAYIIAQDKPSSRNADYLKFVMENTGLDAAGAVALGKRVRTGLKPIYAGVKDKRVPVRVPRFDKALDDVSDISPDIKELHGGFGLPFPRKALPKIEPGIIPEIDAVRHAIRVAKPMRGRMAAMQQREGAKRISAAMSVQGYSREALNNMLGQLAGPKGSVRFTALDLPPKTFDKINRLIRTHKDLSPYDKINAADALRDLMDGGVVPQRSRLILLDKVFGKGFGDEVRQLHGGAPIENIKDLIGDSKAIVASVDMSAPLRQGLTRIHTKEFWTALPTMVKSWASKDFFEYATKAVKEHPLHDTAIKYGLNLADREEMFGNHWADKIPLVNNSSRAYSGFLNKLRMDTFASLTKNLDDMRLTAVEMDQHLAEVAKFVNDATGRGTLPKSLEAASEGLNMLFFSPRLIASRVNMLNPKTYFDASPMIRKEYIKSVMALGAYGLTTSKLLEVLKDGEIETDPRSTDFMKTKIGNTRVDTWGGFQQYVVLASRLGSGKKKSSFTGEVTDLGEKFGSKSERDTLIDFGIGKLSPFAAMVSTMLHGEDFQGDPADARTEISKLITPLIVRDIWELYKTEPDNIPLGLLPFFGAGVQTYDTAKKRTAPPKSPPTAWSWDNIMKVPTEKPPGFTWDNILKKPE